MFLRRLVGHHEVHAPWPNRAVYFREDDQLLAWEFELFDRCTKYLFRSTIGVYLFNGKLAATVLCSVELTSAVSKVVIPASYLSVHVNTVRPSRP